jgi:gluconolactonase
MSFPGFEIFDQRFHRILSSESRLEQIWQGGLWCEGTVWFQEQQCLLWSDIPNNRMLRWSATEGVQTFRQPSNFSNGNYRDLEGRLITCEHGLRRVSRTEPDGSIVTMVDRYQGKRLNSPNDLVCKSDGTIWFTDPPYGIISNYEGYQADQEQDGCYVFRYDPQTTELTVVADDFVRPNGLAFSPDESLLYITDTSCSHDPHGHHHIRVFRVEEGKRLVYGRVFAEVSPGFADGLRIDEQGWIYTSSWDSIQVYTPEGEHLGKILVPEKIANCTFGGLERNRLFIAASTSVYAIALNTHGIQRP